jgi:hypothetical protein
MLVKYTKHFQNKLEDLFAESDYMLRYEKGNFKSGYCVIKEKKVIIVNKYYPLEGKINCLIDILRTVQIDINLFSENNKKFYRELNQTELAI